MLRACLHQDVLFNALNTVSAEVETDPRHARALLETFGTLLRLSLEHACEPDITLARELAYIECYLDLQKMRLDDRLEVIINVDPDTLDALVPAFILQPAIETVMRQPAPQRSTPVRILIEAFREDSVLHLNVHAGARIALTLPFRIYSAP
jgi:two-component system LytT family sensor kinase